MSDHDEKQDVEDVAAEPEVEIDELKLEKYLREVKADQNLPLGLAAGCGAALLGAVIWAVITAATGYQIGWMAVGVGFLVGFAVRSFGKGFDTTFGIAGAVLSLLGCLAGNLLTVCVVFSNQESIPLLDLISKLTLDLSVELMTATFDPIDLLFYGIAVYEGYKFSIRQITEEEMAGFVKES